MASRIWQARGRDGHHFYFAKWVTALVVAMLVVLIASEPVAAENFGDSNGCSYQTGQPISEAPNCISFDSTSIHQVEPIGLGTFAGMAAATEYAVDRMSAQTDVTAFTSTGSGPDVRVFDATYSVNLFAWVDCNSAATIGSRFVAQLGTNERTCTPQDIRYNAAFEGTFNRVEEQRALACHELGHTLGLRHTANDNSCLQEGTAGHEVRSYSEHDVIQVNAEY